MKLGLIPYWSLMRTYLHDNFGKLVALLFLVLTTSIFQVVSPQLLGLYIDTVLQQVKNPLGLTTNQLVLFFLLFVFLNVIAGLLMSIIAEVIGWNASNRVREDALKTVFLANMELLADETPGQLIERIDGDASVLAQFFAKFVSYVAANSLIILFIVIIVSSIHWIVSFAFAFLVFGTFVISNFSRKRIMGYFLKERQATGLLLGTYEDLINAREDILGLNATSYPLKKIAPYEKKKYKTALSTLMASRIFNILISLFIGFGSVLPFIVGVPLFEAKIISIGDIFVISYYATMIFPPTFEIIRQFDSLQKADGSITRLREILDYSNKIISGGAPFPNPPLEITFENLSFTYPNTEIPVLKSISGSFFQGKLNGLVGSTGSGKTTLLRLLQRKYVEYEGGILINGINIKEIDYEEYHQNIFMISQSGSLFSGTLLENLTFYEENPDIAKLIGIMEMIGMVDFLEKINFNMDIPISSLKLSSGQKQMIEVVRALYSNAKILVFDEATSSVDMSFTQNVVSILDKIKKKRLVIVVTHQPEVIAKLDNMLDLDKINGGNNGLPNFQMEVEA